MPHTISDLISSRNLSEADVKSTLVAAGLSLEQNEYTDEDIRDKFDVVRTLFDDKQVNDYETAKELFATLSSVKSPKNRTSKAGTELNKNRKGQKNVSASSNVNPSSTHSPSTQENKQTSQSQETLSITDLMNLVKQHLDFSPSLKQVVTILEASHLPDKEYYTQAEANRFLIACTVIAHGGEGDIGSQIQNTATALETGLIGLVNEVTQERAKQVPLLVKQLYLQNVVMSLAENQEDIESFFMQIKDSIIAGIEGKSHLRSIMEGQWIQTPLPESTKASNQLPATSDNGTSIESSSESKPSG